MNYCMQHKWRLLIALMVTLWLQFLLIPTAQLFYELHHSTGIDGIYWGYSAFKAAGYYFGIWEYQTLACAVVGLLIALPWWQAIKRLVNKGDPV